MKIHKVLSIHEATTKHQSVSSLNSLKGECSACEASVCRSEAMAMSNKRACVMPVFCFKGKLPGTNLAQMSTQQENFGENTNISAACPEKSLKISYTAPFPQGL